MSLFDLIEDDNFRQRTGMYLDEKKISLLKSFMNGYFYKSYINKELATEDELRFDKFNDWVAEYYDWKASTAGWKNIILEECNQNEALALDKFFELYDEFKSQKPLSN